MRKLDLQYPDCPIRNVIARINDKWSLLILCTLQEHPKMRYKELLLAIPDISQKMLSNTLRQLEENHLIHREAFAEIPPRVEYSLTSTDKTLIPAIDVMINWAKEHFEEVNS